MIISIISLGLIYTILNSEYKATSTSLLEEILAKLPIIKAEGLNVRSPRTLGHPKIVLQNECINEHLWNSFTNEDKNVNLLSFFYIHRETTGHLTS